MLSSYPPLASKRPDLKGNRRVDSFTIIVDWFATIFDKFCFTSVDNHLFHPLNKKEYEKDSCKNLGLVRTG